MFKEDKMIAIWGTGKTGKLTYYSLRNKFEIIGWYDNDPNKWGKELFGLPIMKFEKKDINQIIIISSIYWKEIANQLETESCTVLEDYYVDWMLNNTMIDYLTALEWRGKTFAIELIARLKEHKKTVICYGNCQTTLIQQYLLLNKELLSLYKFINIPRVCENINSSWSDINCESLLKECDLFIYQRVSDDNKYGEIRGTNQIISLLRKECKLVCIPNIYFEGYFPQKCKNERNVLMDIQEDGMFEWGDKNIEKLYFEGKSAQEITECLKKKDFYDLKSVEKCVRKSFVELEKREQYCDVIISDYIKENYREKQLFYAPNHPINEVIKECAHRILNFIGIPSSKQPLDDYLENYYSLRGEDIPIYPSVVKEIGLKKYETYYFPNRYILFEAYSFEEYIGKYCQFCFS